MEKKFLLLLFFVFIIPYSTLPQDLKLTGDIKPGSIVIGKADNVESVFLNDNKLQVDANGFFILGFDRDAKGTYTLKVIYNNGKNEIKKLKLPNRKYEIQKIRLAQKYVTPPNEVLDQIEHEAEQMKKARAEVGKLDSALFTSGFVSPVESKRITGVFGSQRIINGVPKNIHNGVDYGVPEGTPVYASTDGIVIIAGNNFYYNGNFVLLDHGHGLTSVYLHMNKLNVKTGERVQKGQKIGEVGSTGRSSGAHLHWGVQWYNKKIDPLSLLNIKL